MSGKVHRCGARVVRQHKQNSKSNRARAVSGGREREIPSSGGFFESCSDTRSPGVPVLLSKSGVPHSAAHSPSPPTCGKKSKQKQPERVVTLLLYNGSTKATLAWLTGIRQKRFEFVCLYNLLIILITPRTQRVLQLDQTDRN